MNDAQVSFTVVLAVHLFKAVFNYVLNYCKNAVSNPLVCTVEFALNSVVKNIATSTKVLFVVCTRSSQRGAYNLTISTLK